MPNRALVVAALLAIVTHAEAEQQLATPRLVVEYTPPAKPGTGVPPDHVARMRVVIGLLQTQLDLPTTITVSYRSCGEANAFYWPSSHRIEICHELWDKRRRLYRSAGHAREEIDRRLRASLTFTFFHEFGHALHDVYKLPLLGRHDDAVDDIATLWMIRLGVGDAARAAAWGHHLRSLQPEYTHDAWDEHGSGAQRGFAIACLLYGSDPQHYATVFDRMSVPAPQIMRCKKEYAQRLEAWQALFGPHLATRL